MIEGQLDYSACDDTKHALEAAHHNYELLVDEWCECDTQTDLVYYRDRNSGSHGWMCGKCRHIIQTG